MRRKVVLCRISRQVTNAPARMAAANNADHIANGACLATWQLALQKGGLPKIDVSAGHEFHYKTMRMIRSFEERVQLEFAAGNVPGFVHTYIGQEASGVGICFDLTDEDYIGSTHRGHGHCIAKGCDVEGMMPAPPAM